MPVATAAMIAGAAIKGAGAILNNSRRNQQYWYEMERYAQDMAALDTNAYMQQEALTGQVAAMKANIQQQQLAVEQNLVADQSMAEVQAATSGTGGQSVNLTQTELAASAGRAQGALDIQEKNFMGAIEQRSRDIEIQADSARRDLEVMDTRRGLLDVFTAGLQGFLMAR